MKSLSLFVYVCSRSRSRVHHNHESHSVCVARRSLGRSFVRSTVSERRWCSVSQDCDWLRLVATLFGSCFKEGM